MNGWGWVGGMARWKDADLVEPDVCLRGGSASVGYSQEASSLQPMLRQDTGRSSLGAIGTCKRSYGSVKNCMLKGTAARGLHHEEADEVGDSSILQTLLSFIVNERDPAERCTWNYSQSKSSAS